MEQTCEHKLQRDTSRNQKLCQEKLYQESCTASVPPFGPNPLIGPDASLLDLFSISVSYRDSLTADGHM